METTGFFCRKPTLILWETVLCLSLVFLTIFQRSMPVLQRVLSVTCCVPELRNGLMLVPCYQKDFCREVAFASFLASSYLQLECEILHLEALPCIDWSGHRAFILTSLSFALWMLGKKGPHPTPLLPSCPNALSGSPLITPTCLAWYSSSYLSVLNENRYQLELLYCGWLQWEILMISPSHTGQENSYLFLHQNEGP